MLQCPVHGLTAASWCCLHVRQAVGRGDPCTLHVIFDDYSDGYLVCPHCLTLAKQYLATVPVEFIVDSYPLDLRLFCDQHLLDWIAETGGESLDAIVARGAERSGQRSERVQAASK